MRGGRFVLQWQDLSSSLGHEKRLQNFRRTAMFHFMQERSQSDAGPKTYQSIHGGAHGKVEDHTWVRMEHLVTKSLWQMGNKREIIDSGTDNDGDEILNPPSETFPEELICH
jgi:hypothetical protein